MGTGLWWRSASAVIDSRFLPWAVAGLQRLGAWWSLRPQSSRAVRARLATSGWIISIRVVLSALIRDRSRWCFPDPKSQASSASAIDRKTSACAPAETQVAARRRLDERMTGVRHQYSHIVCVGKCRFIANYPSNELDGETGSRVELSLKHGLRYS